MDAKRLAQLPGPARLGVGLFVVWILGFHLLAQANLWTRDGDGFVPGPEKVLWKYHGRPRFSRLHQVLDPERPRTHARAMWPFLGEDHEIGPRRTRILDWVDAGAPEAGWPEVEPIFRGELTCGACHVTGGKKEDLPFETLEQVRAVARPDTGMLTTDLLVSAHNHAFGFAVLSLVLSVLVAFAPAAGRLRLLLVLGAFLGSALDVGSWLLTKLWGAPFQWGVILGGGLFGASTAGMCLLVLHEVAGFARRPAPARGPGEAEGVA